jgi:hypothetical protein
MSRVDIAAEELPESSIDGKYNVRYRLVTEDRNQTSSFSDVKTLTLPPKTIQVGSSTSGLIMSAVSVTETVLLSNITPTNDANKLTFSWTPADGVTLDRPEYDLYGYYTDSSLGTGFNNTYPIFLGTVKSTGTYVSDPTSFSTREAPPGMLTSQVIFRPLFVVFALTKKTNTKSIYDFKLNSAGTGVTNSAGTAITQHNVVTFVSPKFQI